MAGAWQKTATFWQRIHQHYNEFKETETERTEDSLSNRWGFISKTVSKSCRVMAQVSSCEKSGEMIQNKVLCL